MNDCVRKRRDFNMKLIVSPMSMIITGLMTFAAIAEFRTAGTVNYPHLLINYDARSVGMAGASAALPGGLNGVAANPAILAGITKQQGFIGYQYLLLGVWAAPIGYSRTIDKVGVISLLLQGLSSGKVDVIDIGVDGEPDSTGQTAHDECFTPSVSFARTFLNSQLYAGVSLKGLYHRMNVPPEIHSSKGMAVDIGIQYRMISDRLIVGAVIRNAGFEFAPFAGDESYPLPLMFEAGISYVPRYVPLLRLAADINKLFVKGDTAGQYLNFEPGLEFEVYPNVLFARFGFMFSQRDLVEQFRKFSGNQDENYIKSNWATLSTGVGITTTVHNFPLQIDLGLQFRTSIPYPSPVLSAIVEF
jgi:hypothetical protein